MGITPGSVSRSMPIADLREDMRHGPGGRTTYYDRGRVRFFAELYLSGYHCDPLVIDNVCDRGHILPQAALIDGYHRLCGALLAGRSRIPISYSGRLDVLRWLCGERLCCPLT